MSDPTPQWLDTVTWSPSDEVPNKGSGLPYATHQGIWTDPLFGMHVRCYRLSDGRAIFHADDFNAFMEKFLGEDG